MSTPAMTQHPRILVASLLAGGALAAALACAPGARQSDADDTGSRLDARDSQGDRGVDRDGDGSRASRGSGAEDRDRGGFLNLFEREDRVDVPAGTSIPVQLTSSVESGSADVGTDVSGTVTSNVSVDGKVVVPSGSTARGEVVEVRSAKRFGGQAMIAVAFSSVETPDGKDIPVEGRLEAYGKKQTGKDTATIAGSAVGGAILGEILDDKPVEGAVVGGGIGTAVASRRGDEAELTAGREVVVRTTSSVQVESARL